MEIIKDIILNSKLNKHYPKIIIKEKKECLIIYLNFGKYKYIEFPLNSEYQKNLFKIDENYLNYLNEIEEDMKIFDSFIDLYDKNEKKIENLKNEQIKLKIEIYKEKISNNNFYFYNINEHYVLIQSNYKSNKI